MAEIYNLQNVSMEFARMSTIVSGYKNKVDECKNEVDRVTQSCQENCYPCPTKQNFHSPSYWLGVISTIAVFASIAALYYYTQDMKVLTCLFLLFYFDS
jgi:hypothetical protein